MDNMFLKAFDPNVDNVINRLIKKGLVPHDPRIILYKYRPAEWAKQMLRGQYLPYSATDAFEDELEFNFENLDFSITPDAMKPKLLKLLGLSTSSPERKEELYSTTTIDEFTNSYRQVLEFNKKNTPVLCSSLCHNDPDMWYKFGDKHKGVCIGYRMLPIDDNEEFFTVNVNYVDKVSPQLVFSDEEYDSISAEAILYWMNTKSIKFKLEQEVRTVLTATNQRFFTPEVKWIPILHPKELFLEIYYGINTPKRDIYEIELIVEAFKYNVQKMERVVLKEKCVEFNP